MKIYYKVVLRNEDGIVDAFVLQTKERTSYLHATFWFKFTDLSEEKGEQYKIHLFKPDFLGVANVVQGQKRGLLL